MAVAAAVVDLDDVDGCVTVFRMNPRANQLRIIDWWCKQCLYPCGETTKF